jgi:hypothetical protein
MKNLFLQHLKELHLPFASPRAVRGKLNGIVHAQNIDSGRADIHTVASSLDLFASLRAVRAHEADGVRDPDRNFLLPRRFTDTYIDRRLIPACLKLALAPDAFPGSHDVPNTPEVAEARADALLWASAEAPLDPNEAAQLTMEGLGRYSTLTGAPPSAEACAAVQFAALRAKNFGNVKRIAERMADAGMEESRASQIAYLVAAAVAAGGGDAAAAGVRAAMDRIPLLRGLNDPVGKGVDVAVPLVWATALTRRPHTLLTTLEDAKRLSLSAVLRTLADHPGAHTLRLVSTIDALVSAGTLDAPVNESDLRAYPICYFHTYHIFFFNST